MMDQDERAEFERLMDLTEDQDLNEWEQHFLDSLEQQAANPFWSPTERQLEKLEQIANR